MNFSRAAKRNVSIAPKSALVEANRFRLKDGNQLVILGYSQLITKHRQSKNIYRFTIDFGDFYALLAKEYAAQYDPEGLSFELKAFEQFAKSALKLYTEVVQVDGIIEKIEAQGKIEAMRGLNEKVTRLSQSEGIVKRFIVVAVAQRHQRLPCLCAGARPSSDHRTHFESPA